jgi:hypothetical protein
MWDFRIDCNRFDMIWNLVRKPDITWSHDSFFGAIKRVLTS